MAALEPIGLRVVLYEGAGSTPLAPDRRRELLSRLLEAGYQVTRSVPGGNVSPVDGAALLVLGQFEDHRVRDGVGEGKAPVEFCDVQGLDGPAILEAVQRSSLARGGEKPGAWNPWFPVIDYDRCTNCLQCLSFCLFDVYGVDGEARITVQKEDNCKTSCPACSRVCPEAAIMFPKYKKGPINGDIVRPEDLQSEAMKVDISALLGGDIYAALRNRQKAARVRFSTERDESKALMERKRCLKKLKKNLDIPDEVLMSLPSAGDIQERARRAMEKHEKRMARSRTMQDQRPAATEDEWGI